MLVIVSTKTKAMPKIFLVKIQTANACSGRVARKLTLVFKIF